MFGFVFTAFYHVRRAELPMWQIRKWNLHLSQEELDFFSLFCLSSKHTFPNTPDFPNTLSFLTPSLKPPCHLTVSHMFDLHGSLTGVAFPPLPSSTLQAALEICSLTALGLFFSTLIKLPLSFHLSPFQNSFINKTKNPKGTRNFPLIV